MIGELELNKIRMEKLISYEPTRMIRSLVWKKLFSIATPY